jgi:hypothetical protein
MNRVITSFLAGIIVTLSISRSSPALTLNWNNNLGGSYTAASNWTDSANSANHLDQ